MNERFIVLVTTAPSLHEVTRELATRLAGRANAVLVFLHVVPAESSDGVGMLHRAVELASGEIEGWVRSQSTGDSGVCFRHRLETGDPVEVVESFVRTHEVELLVVEEPPRNWLSETLWRGLAERLIRRVDCPVVIGGPGFLRSDSPLVPAVRPPLAGTTVAELLDAMVESRVQALRGWMDHAADSVRRIADSPSVRTWALRLAQGGAWMDSRSEQRLTVELSEHRRALRALGWQLTVGEQVWSGGQVDSASGLALLPFLQRVAARGRSTSLPLQIQDKLVIFAGALVADGAGMLLFGFDAESDFLRILGQPGPLPSFETYAFDQRGMMLSNSKFPEHLIAAGLLPADGAQTPLFLRVAEPSEGPAKDWPLTHMARHAVRHEDGFNIRGYLDYRGKAVVGAWRWVPEYGFGVTAEVDQDAGLPLVL